MFLVAEKLLSQTDELSGIVNDDLNGFNRLENTVLYSYDDNFRGAVKLFFILVSYI